MAYQTQILEACIEAGFKHGYEGPGGVIELGGWRYRGSSSFRPRGSVNHHVAAGPKGNLATSVLVDGRAGLAGPLCNAGLGRNACIYLIAAGRANHAGEGGWKGLTGNSSVWGLEVQHTGYASEPVSAAMWNSMYRWHAACMLASGFSAAFVCQHFEWATPPGRKSDFVRAITNPGNFRANVANFAAGKGGIINPGTSTPKDWFDMATLADLDRLIKKYHTDLKNDIAHLQAEHNKVKVAVGDIREDVNNLSLTEQMQMVAAMEVNLTPKGNLGKAINALLDARENAKK